MEIKREWIYDEYEEDGETVKLINRKFLLIPGCCEESVAALRPYMKLNFGDAWLKDEELLPDNATPEWVIPHLDYEYIIGLVGRKIDENFRDVGYEKTIIPVKFCPYCGTNLPKTRKKKTPPTPVISYADNYCGTCDKRIGKYGSCICWPMEALFEVVDE
jgi:hypothetical protein